MFSSIRQNIKGYDALQAFTKQRLLQASEKLTEQMLRGQMARKLQECKEMTPCKPGAVGGSIFVSHEMFFKVGGFDPELFTEYSLEDQFFWDKVNLMGTMGKADNPPIEMLHLWHPTEHRQTKPDDLQRYLTWKGWGEDKKKEYIEKKSNHLKQFIK